MTDLQASVVFDAYPKVSVREFLPELTFEFTEMPEEGMPHFVLRAINRIARQSNCLRRTATIHTQPCVDNYLLEPQDCMDIVAVMSVCKHGGCGCSDVTRITSEPCHLPCGTMSWFEAPNTIYFSNTRHHNVFRVSMSVAPTYETCEVDRILLTNFYDTVLNGTKFYLYSMTDKPWSSVNRAQEYEVRFLQGIRSAALEALTGGQRGMFRTKRPRIL